MNFQTAYIENYGSVRKYTEDLYKVSLLRMFHQNENKNKVYVEKNSVNDEKLDNNISRARSTIFDYAYCNDWDFFVTLTIDGNKHDRYDLKKYNKDLSQYIRNFNRKYGGSVKFLLIPEPHKDEAWHIHGLIYGIPPERLSAFSLSKKDTPSKIRKRLEQGIAVYSWIDYAEKFGFCDLEAIENKEACIHYITKYITKEQTSSVKALGAHSFYASKGLKKSAIIHQDTANRELPCPAYSNDYCASQFFNSLDEAMSIFA